MVKVFLTMSDNKKKALIAINRELELKENKSQYTYTVNYYCDQKSDFFFYNIIRPLFLKEINSGRLILKKEPTLDALQSQNNLIWLVVYTPDEILTGSANHSGNVNLFAQDLLISGTGQHQVPIIHISLLDFFRGSLFGKETPPKSLPRYYPIVDSSIWNHLVFISKESDVFRIGLFRAIKSILKHYELGYYSLEIACEYADLNSRMLKESFLTGAHAKGVSPFIFHSETRLKKETQKLINTINEYGKNLKWRFLLLDDKVLSDIDSTGDCYLTKSDGRPSRMTKTDIIKERLEELRFPCVTPVLRPSEDPDKDILKGGIELVYVNSVTGALNLMSKYQFDIILLDYLLKDDYGYRLLHEVKNAVDIKGPYGELFFMFISAFSTAVSERLTFEGLSRNERNKWQIGEGACPTNTPELFKFRLLQLMEYRLRQTCIKGLSYNGILEQLEVIFEVSAKGNAEARYQRIKSVREKAYHNYKDILGLHYDYFVLKEDEEKSLLVNSFMRDKDHMDALLEHLLQFVHLIAFGTVRQWPEIWEEYQFVIRTLNVSADDTKTNMRIRRVSKLIEKHIIDLKSA